MIKMFDTSLECGSRGQSSPTIGVPVFGLLAGLLSAVLWVLSIPPFEFAEGAYVAFVPLLLWLYTKPSRRAFWIIAIGTGWVA
ncbi:MAG TPA: hypothetical protein DCY38_05645, partial [Opitutae bacterium]|nr:hypothetical protein [Opitutae bacterium]